MKLLAECEKLKKLMAVNISELPIDIQIDGQQLTGTMELDRALFEKLVSSHLANIERVMRWVLSVSKLRPEEIHRSD